MIVIGGLIILLGLIVDYHFNKDHDAFVSAISHLFIILGEAIIVMFFLHVVIEEKNHSEYRAIIDELKEKSIRVIEEQTSKVGIKFNELFEGVNAQVQETTERVRGNLFEAILKDRMPHDMVQVMLASNFFSPTFLRRNLVVKYVYHSCDENTLKMKHYIDFEIENVLGKDPTSSYEMPLSLSDSPLAKYKLLEVGYKRVNTGETTTFTENDFNRSTFAELDDKDLYSLKKSIEISKKEKVKIYQIIEATFPLQKAGVVDNYFVNQHTLDTTITIEFPEEYEFIIYPTFPEKNLPAPELRLGYKCYPNIAFLVPGQGWGYSILRKNS